MAAKSTKASRPRVYPYPEKDELLIETVRSYPLLYRKSDPHYKMKSRRENTWKLVAAVVDLPVETCQSRWITLRDRYVRERKIAVDQRSGDETFIIETWPLYELLSFYRDDNPRRPTTGNFTENTNSPPISDDEPDIEDIVDEVVVATDHFGYSKPSQGLIKPNMLIKKRCGGDVAPQFPTDNCSSDDDSQPILSVAHSSSVNSQLRPSGSRSIVTPVAAPTASSTPTPPSVARNRKRNRPDEQLDDAIVSLTTFLNSSSQSNINDNDDDVLFFKSLAPIARRLPMLKKLKLRSEVQNLVFNAWSEYENFQ